jgi:uncharacterized repeat protein (TIGR01451 family)
MTDSTNRFVQLVRAAGAALLACAALLAVAAPAHAACTVGACVTAGPRLASVDTQKSALLNPLLGSLLGTSLSLTAADWNSLATGNVQVLGFLNALQASTNASSPTQALAANVTLAQVAAALGVQAQAQANTSLSAVLQTLASQLNGAGATVRVGDLLKLTADSGTLGTTTVNALDMLTGLVQLYNTRNVLSTPKPVGIDGGVLGQAGLINSVALYSQVIEPPVYVCGPAGSAFHSAAIRVKLKLDLVTLSPVTSVLTVLPGVSSASIAISKLDVYLEIARGEGTLASVDAVSRAVTLQVAPGIADAYIGTIADSVFFNRSRTLSAADVDYGQVGSLVLNGAVLAIEVKSTTRGQAPFSTSVTMSGTFPQTRTVSTSTAFATSMADSLVSNLALRTTPSLGLLDAVVSPVLKTLVVGTLSPVITPVLTGVADPLLKLLGIGLGQVTVTVEGICDACAAFKLTKAVDKAGATPGTTITYTITYENQGTTTLTDLKITDPTPAFTTYAASACGTLGAGLTGCTITTQPAAGATGNVVWQFNGTLSPGASGNVNVSVKVQ